MCQWSITDWEKHLPSIEYEVTIERTIVGPDALEGSCSVLESFGDAASDDFCNEFVSEGL